MKNFLQILLSPLVLAFISIVALGAIFYFAIGPLWTPLGFIGVPITFLVIWLIQKYKKSKNDTHK